MEFELSEKAARQVRSVQEREGKGETYLRVSVVGGGCSGMSYKMSFDENKGDNDVVIESHGVKLALDPKSILFLKGTQLDFSDGLNGTGFVFNNPNAKTSCGCGSSFST